MLALAPTVAHGQDAWPSSPKKDEPKPKQPKPKSAPRNTPPNTDALKEEADKLFGPGTTRPSGQDADQQTAGWTIIIAVFRGDDAAADAAKMLQRIRTEGALPEAFVARRNEAYSIAVGDFPAADDERAVKELARVQNLELANAAGDASKPYQHALLAPPAGSPKGAMPQYNLLQARKQHGDDAIYTLQIGAYGNLGGDTNAKNLEEVRKAAEEAAYKLRQEGEQAFYYHGPSMSMVTIGAFTIDDFNPQVPNFKSARLRDAQKRHPNNLYNGQAVREKIKGAPNRLQPSNLVAIPTK